MVVVFVAVGESGPSRLTVLEHGIRLQNIVLVMLSSRESNELFSVLEVLM